MKFYKLLEFFAFAILILTFGCKNDKNRSNVITLSFWHSFTQSTTPALNELINEFEKNNPGIIIHAQYIPTGDALIQKLVTAIQGKTAPDISWIHSDFIEKLVTADAIYKMDDFIKGKNGITDEELSDIYPQLLQNAEWQSTLYGMPMEATTLALLYNKDLFKDAGLNQNHPPENWNELYDYSKKLTKDKNHDGKIDQYGFYIPVFPASGQLSVWMVLQWTPFLWQAGGSEIKPNQSEVVFNSAAGLKALSFWKRIYDALSLNNFSLSHDLGFSSGTLAMIMDGPWDIPFFKKFKNLNWGVASLPAGPAGSATYIAGEHIVIFKQSKHPDEAWKFIKWIIRPDVQARFSMNSGYLPIRKSSSKLNFFQEYLSNNQQMKAFVDQLKIARARAPIDHYRVEINQNIAEAVEKTIIGNIDPTTALNEAAEKSNILLHKQAGY